MKQKTFKPVKAWALFHEANFIKAWSRRMFARNAKQEWNTIVPVLITPIQKPRKTNPSKK